LKPYTTYYYQFNVCNSSNKSPVGRTKTTPHANDDITKVSLAVFSCSNYPFGFFNAFGNPVRKVCPAILRFVAKQLTMYRTRLIMWYISVTTFTNTRMATMAGEIPLVAFRCPTRRSTVSTTTARGWPPIEQIWTWSPVTKPSLGCKLHL
jgi:hypothetical protein